MTAWTWWTWQEDAKTEKWELDRRERELARLLQRYKNGDNSRQIAFGQIELMREQLEAMRAYSMVLWRRVLLDAAQYRVPRDLRALSNVEQLQLAPKLATKLAEFTTSYKVHVHAGVFVVDDDDRALDIVDVMPTDWRNELFAIHGHEGTASFLWRRPLTQSVYVEGEQFDMPDGDVWNVDQSIVV